MSIQSDIPPNGFTNTGSICYFNSLMQALLSSKFFLNQSRPNLLFGNFLDNIYINHKWDEFFTTRVLESMGGMNPNQSSSEYLLALIEFLHLDSLFEYTYTHTRTCLTCGDTSNLIDKSVASLVSENFVEFFSYSETIKDFYCEKCLKKVETKRDRILSSASPLIVISLNKYGGNKEITYPPIFKISDITYNLVSTVEHVGGLNGGHYFARVFRNGEVYLIDDSNVSKLPDMRCVIETYLLFYERQV